ncbi:S1 family peptidase [Pseudarthrobacter sp. NS4]|uniref:S1 family peptidase n=1 Tax=Pseudarthrobacter sp. NS4 TaxID=2973976 RepID=UPI0028682B75|nr:S1 family peptidase [Pseudarthrobacter sp. NS4]
MTAAKLRQVLSLGAAAGVLASSTYLAAPAWAAGEPGTGTSSGSTTDGSALSTTALSESALADAVQRDLGLTPEEFTAAGELGAQAAAVAVQLRDVPGYVGIRLEAGQIVVSGSGSELLGKVAALAATTPELAVEAPSPAPALEAKTEASGAAADPDPAPSSSPAEGVELAVSAEQLFQAYVREVGPQSLQAVMASGGKFVIRTGGINSPESTGDSGAGSAASAGSGKLSPAAFVARYANVELDGGAPLAPEADVPGGVGYRTDFLYICSTGFSAFDPAGLPAVLSAGHCASDGAALTATLEFQGTPAGLLGEFGFSQFGGPGNSPIIEDPLDPDYLGNVGTDISVIESLRPDLDPLPAASTWGNPSEPGPDVKVIGSTDPVAGMPVCRSGRTSAWSCGTVDAVGIFVVPGPAYAADPTDLRAFHGFLSFAVQSSGGDSGGPYLSGNYAVGTHAAGDTPDENGNVIENFAVGATLRDSLAVLPGYELELFLNKPAVTAPAPGATYEPGQLVSGTVPAAPASAVAAGSKVRITVQGEDPFEVPVDDAGNWTFPAPEGNGALKFTAETVNGFSVSGAGSFEFAPAATESPAPTAPPEPTPAGPVPAPTEPTPADPTPTAPADPSDGAAVVVNPPASSPPADLADTGASRNAPAHTGGLAYTGSTALLPAAAAAAAAIAVGGVLMALVRRRKRRAAE